MSKLMDMITGQLSSGLIDEVTSRMGGNKEATQRTVAAALPLLLGALKRNTQSQQGASSLANALQKDHSGDILSNLGSAFTSPSSQSTGSKILGHILGSKQSQVSQQLGQATGIGGEKAGQMMAMLAPVLMGALGKAKQERNLDSSGLQDFLGRENSRLQKSQPQMGMLEGMLDSDGDGDVDMKDILAKGSGLLGGFFKS